MKKHLPLKQTESELIKLLIKLQSPHEHKCGLCGTEIIKCKERIIKLLKSKYGVK